MEASVLYLHLEGRRHVRLTQEEDSVTRTLNNALTKIGEAIRNSDL